MSNSANGQIIDEVAAVVAIPLGSNVQVQLPAGGTKHMLKNMLSKHGIRNMVVDAYEDDIIVRVPWGSGNDVKSLVDEWWSRGRVP